VYVRKTSNLLLNRRPPYSAMASGPCHAVTPVTPPPYHAVTPVTPLPVSRRYPCHAVTPVTPLPCHAAPVPRRYTYHAVTRAAPLPLTRWRPALQILSINGADTAAMDKPAVGAAIRASGNSLVLEVGGLPMPVFVPRILSIRSRRVCVCQLSGVNIHTVAG